MLYVSTRGGGEPCTFSDILLQGLAPDGGLFVPQSWPKISLSELEAWKDVSYAEMAAKLLQKFAPEIPFEVLLSLTHKAYSADVFCNARAGEDRNKIFPVRKLDDDLHLLQVSNGPTLAFKDAAMQLLGGLLNGALEVQEKSLTILGATSGDTGSAAIYALRGLSKIKVVMLSPKGRMSAFQRAQMYSVLDDSILNIAVDGTFDDCQDLVKKLNADSAYKSKHRLGAVNSINWARVVAQTCYYVSAYLQTVKHVGDPVSFAVPSGNFGNAFAGLVSKLIGIPIGRLIVATNENDVLHRAFTTGCYEPRAVAVVTSSPSMDITKASNFERAVWAAADGDGYKVAEMWRRLDKVGSICFVTDYPDVWNKICGLGIVSSTSTHQDRLEQIRQAYNRWGLFIDPHTADGMKGATFLRQKNETMIVLETAQAAKFSETLVEALGIAPPVPLGFDDLCRLPQRVDTIANNPNELKAKIDAFDA